MPRNAMLAGILAIGLAAGVAAIASIGMRALDREGEAPSLPRERGIESPGVPITHGQHLDDHNTGISSERELTDTGSIRTRRRGEVIENLRTPGIVVAHDDVTIRNVEVNGTSIYGIQVEDGVTGLYVEHVSIVGVSGQRVSGISPQGDWHARRIQVRGYEDGVKMGSRQVLEESLIVDDYHRPDGAHNDGLQFSGGSNTVIRNNRIDGPHQAQTSAIIIQTDFGPVHDVTVEGNYLSGGNYTMYIRRKGDHPPPYNITVVDNIFEADSWRYGPLSLDEGDGWRWENNRTSDGEPL